MSEITVDAGDRWEAWAARAERTALTRGAIAALAASGSVEDLAAAFASSLQTHGARAALRLGLALASHGVELDPAVVGELICDDAVSRPLAILVGACRGDRIAMLMECAESGRLSYLAEAMTLALARRLMADAAPPRRFLVRLRAAARWEILPEVEALLAVAAQGLEPADLGPVASHFALVPPAVLAELTAEFDAKLAGPVLEALPEEEGPRVISGFTFVRTEAKVGRNEPCPCGSGRKYKKCCGRDGRGREAPPSLRRQFEAIDPRVAGVRSHLFERLSPADLARLDAAGLTTLQLVQGARSLFWSHRWEAAERFLSELDGRTDAPSEVGGYHHELAEAALAAGEVSLAERHFDVSNPTESERRRFRFSRALAARSPDALEQLEEMSLSGLDGSVRGGLVDAAHALLDHLPAVGIAVARGALNPENAIDSGFLLERMEEARDRLWIDPCEPWWEYYDRLREQEEQLAARDELREERAALASTLDDLRARLRDEAARVRDLEADMARRTDEMAALTAQRDELADVVAASGAAADRERASRLEQERRRLRAKIEELQGRISEGTRERMALREQMAGLSKRHRDAPTAKPDRPDRESPAPDENGGAAAGIAPRREVLVPSYAPGVTKALREIPRRTARDALLTAAALAAGEAHAWASVKAMRAAREIFSARVGQSYRLLFHVTEGSLECLALIHRRELEQTLAALSKTIG
jgi:hypothetical protein